LFLGTAKDNTQDMLSKERQARGEKNGTAVLSEDQVREIYRLKGKLGATQVSKQFGISVNPVYEIWRGSRWGHVTKLLDRQGS
jgi:hypothetical protein